MTTHKQTNKENTEMAIPATIQKASDRMREHSDCAVKAVAIVCGVSYKVAHQALKEQGRMNRKGTYSFMTHNAIRSLGKVTIPCSDRFKAKTINTLAKELPSRGVFLVSVKGHVLACRGGQILDWTEGRRHRILEIHKVK